MLEDGLRTRRDIAPSYRTRARAHHPGPAYIAAETVFDPLLQWAPHLTPALLAEVQPTSVLKRLAHVQRIAAQERPSKFQLRGVRQTFATTLPFFRPDVRSFGCMIHLSTDAFCRYQSTTSSS